MPPQSPALATLPPLSLNTSDVFSGLVGDFDHTTVCEVA